MNNRVPFFGLSVFLLMSIASTWAYDVETHKAVGEKATDVSSVDGVLKTELGFAKGKDTLFSNKSAKEWIGDGARFEDSPPTRLLNHFHNPLRPWDQAGLRFGFQLGQSSVLWQQNTNQNFSSVFIPVPFPPFFLPSFSFGGNWSWQDARQRYLEALTGSRGTTLLTKQEREQAFADTFRALGQLSHIIQDASVPAHVRNDRHPPVLNPDWYEDWVQETRQTNSSLFQGLLNLFDKDRHRPSFSIFTPTGNSQAPVPIARLMDTDKFLGLNFSVLTDPGLGITEYTNGNFLSRDTIFKDFDLPRQSSLEPDFFVEPFGAKFRRYLRKTSEGESPIDHFVTESLLHESIKDALGAGPLPAAAWYLDDRVHEDYARLLLPRAVGYSAGLLDYFFRGKLDVDLVQDPNSSDPTVVKLSGTNGSPDKFDGGTLTLYADDPITGERSPVPALDPNFTVVADPGQPVESTKFQINAEAERFMAVYKGKLGNEAPQGDFPGGVIGKVLGGVRAESIFGQGDKRMLRTVDGVFPLPAETDRLDFIQWGDQDNTFVGILPDPANPRIPGQVVAFKINRDPSSQAPLLVDSPDGVKRVSADVLKTVPFPLDRPISADVTVDYSQTFPVKQLLLTFDVIDTFVFVQTDPNDPNRGFFNFASRNVTAPTVETVVDTSVQFSQNFRIVLDRDHLFGLSPGGEPDPYTWFIEDVAFDGQGRPLVLIRVVLTAPDNSFQRVNLKKHDFFTGQLIETSFADDGLGFIGNSVRGYFHISDFLCVIDVEKQKVLGVTVGPQVLLSSEEPISGHILQRHQKTIFLRDGAQERVFESWQDARFVQPNPAFPTNVSGAVAFPPSGVRSLTLSDVLRDDLAPLVNVPVTISNETSTNTLVYFVDDVSHTNWALQGTLSTFFQSGALFFGTQAQMTRPSRGGSPDTVLLYDLPLEDSFQEKGKLIRWSPEFPSNTALAPGGSLPAAEEYDLRFATSEWALVESEVCNDDCEEFSLLMPLSDGATLRLPGNLRRNYVLLDPKFLYNINDNRFHTLDSTLRATVLPHLLAPAPQVFFPPPVYHLIKLR